MDEATNNHEWNMRVITGAKDLIMAELREALKKEQDYCEELKERGKVR